MGAAKKVIFLGINLGLSFICLLLAGIIYRDWLAMLNLVAITVVPIAAILSDVNRSSGYGGYDEMKAAMHNMSSALFGVILISLFGLPLVLFHKSAISGGGFGLWIGSTVITFVGAVWYWIARIKERESYF